MPRERQKRLASPSHPTIKVTFLGAAGDVTGSLILFEYVERGKKTRFILDVGLDQENEKENFLSRLPKGVRASMIDFVVISHAHVDHSGWLPKLIKNGFTGYAYTHPATRDLMQILLADSGHLQEASAERINKIIKRRGKSFRLQPLYTQDEGADACKRVKTLDYNARTEITDGVAVTLTEACHILGSAVVTVEIGKGKNKKTVCFTGNIGRPNTAVLKDLAPVAEADYVICESTYGDALHAKVDRLQALADVINSALDRAKQADKKYGSGVIVIPAFAIGRVQAMLFDLRQLMTENRIPTVPVFLDSPMALAATKVYRKHKHLYNAEAQRLVAKGVDPFKTPIYAELTQMEDSRRLDGKADRPFIVIGSSGMAAGGRIRNHIQKRLPGKQNTIVFCGHQEEGALGYELVTEKAKQVVMHGETINVNARIEYLPHYSGHADYSDIITWMRNFERKPKQTFLVHGEPKSLTGLKKHIEDALGWNVVVPQHKQSFEL